MRFHRLITCLLGIAAGGICPASAQDQKAAMGSADEEKNVHGYISVGAGLLPDYIGSKYYEAIPFVTGRVNYGNYYARFEDGALRFNILDNSSFHLGPLVGFQLDRGSVDSPAVSKMRHLDFSVTDGAFLEYEHVATDPRSSERITLMVADGNINQSSGWTITVRGGITRPLAFINEGLIASIEADTTWGDQPFMRTYFGVNNSDSALSGLPPYIAHSGIEGVGAALSLDQFLSPKWGVGVRFHYMRLLNSAAHSPITQIAGSKDQFFAAFVINYVL
ncbi:MAG TPA: MipA/OmpV family protein [Micropepsaceae bacterium]|jgi:outer membrane scaffolding protein for murein synthesis (MipA/OmpV family)|nr:MipA/OmpV family protein [Micropepsaceae bacterium]